MPLAVLPRAKRRQLLAEKVKASSIIAMPACSTCHKAGEICRVSNLYASCVRCSEKGSRCDVSLDDKECEHLLVP